jgi:thioredoxin 2
VKELDGGRRFIGERVGDREMDDRVAEIIQCPNCGAQNRIPRERIDSQANCGRCHTPLPMGRHDDHSGVTHVVRCSECGAKNRVPSNKLSDQPKCGKCGTMLRTHDLFEPQPILISDHNFPDKVLKSPLPVLVFAMSPTCPYCDMVAPHVQAIAREYKGRLKVGQLNIQFNPDLATKFDLLSVPNFLIFDKGRLQESIPGALDRAQINALVSRYLY